MAHITLSIPDETRKIMKEHPEIKWSEIARQGIQAKAASFKNKITGEEFLSLLSKETRESIARETPEEGKAFYKKLKEKEWKRAQYLIHP